MSQNFIKRQVTPSQARLTSIKKMPGEYNWVFVPGGPGLGSESLAHLTDLLSLPGTTWHMDFPGDGSNVIDSDPSLESWYKSIQEIPEMLSDVIFVGHSTGGMLILSTPNLEDKLKGLVLISSAPNASWQEGFSSYVGAHPLPGVDTMHNAYAQAPSDELLKELTIACASYVAREDNLEPIRALMASLPFNSKAQLMADRDFDADYKAAWIPQKIPTLICAGDQDVITPLSLFLDDPYFQRENIHMRTIPNAAHFPWMDNPEAVKSFFDDYVRRMLG